MSNKTFPTNPEAFLDRFTNLERSRDPDFPRTLERMRAWLDACARPDRAGHRTIIVAGTKGKGSTAAILASLLTSSGLKTGLYTSPHLESWSERIRVDGQSIGDTDAAEITARLEERIERAEFPFGMPTYFEMMTAMALMHFARASCDTAVLEVGLGGEFDATNACDADTAVITPIGHDHIRVLGPTLADIAHAKAGVIKAGVPVVVSPQVREAMEVIEKTARERRSPLYLVGRDARVEPVSFTENSQSFFISGPEGRDGPFDLPLIGRHQAENAAAAYLALSVFLQQIRRPLDYRAAARGFRDVRWPGRLETLPSAPRVVLDGAHTPESAEALRDGLSRHFGCTRIELVLGMMSDKNIESFIEPLRGALERVHIAPIPCERAFAPEELERRLKAMGIRVRRSPSLEESLAEARKACGEGTLVVVTGSLYLVGLARRILA